MHSLAARIALLAYVVGGLAIPAVHRHAPGTGHHAPGLHSHSGHAHSSHSHGSHSHSSPSGSDAREPAADADHCCHSPAPAKEAAPAADCAPAPDTARDTALAATSPHHDVCGEDCVVCIFAGSSHATAAGAATTLSAALQGHFSPDHRGPGFTASDLPGDRLRGPPASVILG